MYTWAELLKRTTCWAAVSLVTYMECKATAQLRDSRHQNRTMFLNEGEYFWIALLLQCQQRSCVFRTAETGSCMSKHMPAHDVQLHTAPTQSQHITAASTSVSCTLTCARWQKSWIMRLGTEEGPATVRAAKPRCMLWMSMSSCATNFMACMSPT